MRMTWQCSEMLRSLHLSKPSDRQRRIFSEIPFRESICTRLHVRISLRDTLPSFSIPRVNWYISTMKNRNIQGQVVLPNEPSENAPTFRVSPWFALPVAVIITPDPFFRFTYFVQGIAGFFIVVVPAES